MESDLQFSDAIAATRTLVALEGRAAALQRRLPAGWELAPYTGEDLRGATFNRANMLVAFHEVYAVRDHQGQPSGVQQLSYVVFVSQARNDTSGALGHVHWHAYTEDPAGVPGKYRDAVLAHIARTQTHTKERRGETRVSERFSAVADSGAIHLSLEYEQGGPVVWVTADGPNLPLYAAKDPGIVRWYQEDQVLDVVRSEPMKIDRTTHFSLTAEGELRDVFDGSERLVAVVIQRPYMRRVYVPRAR